MPIVLLQSVAIYTITSDLGKENYLTAIVKGCIYERNPSAKIIEISSDVVAFDVYQTTYLFKSAYHYFPKGTHHFILSGLYNTDFQNLLIAEYDGHFIYFTDNGFASLALPKDIKIGAVKLDNQFSFQIGNIAKAFAQASFFINKGTFIDAFTTPYTLQYQPIDIDLIVRNNELVAQVLFIDRFKNVVINLTKVEFENYRNGRNFTIEFIGKEKINAISNSYSDVTHGRKLCFFNNAGYMELAVRGGNASELFGFETGEQVDDIYKTIKIFFE
ncbi:MAG: hypothetical protein RLZZ118_1157 [Bacteroidota bacterium]